MSMNKIRKGKESRGAGKAVLALLLLCAILMPVLCSCGEQEDVPQGMQIATLDGALYRLYIPRTWTSNTNSGTSGGYFSNNDICRVSFMPVEKSGYTEPEDYGAHVLEAMEARFPDYELVNESEVTLGGETAKAYLYTFTYMETPCKYTDLILSHEGVLYRMLFAFTQENYDGYSDDRDSIVNDFRFMTVPYKSDEIFTIPSDVAAPDGMKLASFDRGAFRLFVPSDWRIASQNGVALSYVSDADRSSVSMIPYMPDEDSMSIPEYFALCEKSYAASLPGYTLVSKTEFHHDTDTSDSWTIKMGGRVANRYEYKATVDGVEYHYLQYVASYATMFYVLTYTSTEALFDSHLSQVEQIRQAVQLGY